MNERELVAGDEVASGLAPERSDRGAAATADPHRIIVGIGASAGGLTAFTAFLRGMPAISGMSFVLVQHLAPDHKSMLSDLLGQVTGMSVFEAQDGASLAPDTVYVIPPDATLTMLSGRLRVSRPAPPRARRRAIDTFFESLAEDQGENAICIVLSGTGSDGALGLSALRGCDQAR